MMLFIFAPVCRKSRMVYVAFVGDGLRAIPFLSLISLCREWQNSDNIGFCARLQRAIAETSGQPQRRLSHWERCRECDREGAVSG